MTCRGWVILLLLLWPGMAFAYIDPGSGAYLIQLVIAGIAAAAFYFARPIVWIKAFFRRLFRRDKA